ncbi:MAG TPA: GNAT family N-acetyltransferase [Ktedonobacteraceae bacterium]|nr:GNAT family N-acetyltransferase [Ktedonobacteraceae bacterium]
MTYWTLIEVAETLVGERALLRTFEMKDAEALFAAIEESREHFYPWYTTFSQKPHDIAETRDLIVRWQARWLLREGFLRGLFLRDSGQFLGSLGFRAEDWESRSFGLTYWLRQSAEGRGYISEAVRLLTEYLFTHLEAQRVEIRCDARNQRSAALARRLGFQEEGCLRNSRMAADGVLENTLIFSLIPSDPRLS